MAILKCTVCGGELDVSPDLTVGKCQYCGSLITIPKELDRKGNLYNRAVFLRQNNEFDKAAAAYEDILKEDNSDAEAHWGLVLSKLGIEYVADPKTGDRMPTCHRTQAESILSDPDYLAALKYSSGEARDVIEKDARQINDIQAKIIEISQKEPPYDIFICYKESDDAENRTEDSTLAQDLYYELIKKGYQVFFARKTLEHRLGSEFEPIIYAALNSAKVMIVLGTKPEYFNAVWVRNEWSRFRKMTQRDSKLIIPAYRGISPYELPAELSVFQSLDMSKIGFMQDLTDGIERYLHAEKGPGSGPAAETAPRQSTGTVPLERLIQNGGTYLKLNNFPMAEEVYVRITQEYPEDYRGWWGLMVCKTRNFNEVSLDQSQLNVWFQYVRQLAKQNEYAALEKTYADYTRKVSLLAAESEVKELQAKVARYREEISSGTGKISSVNTVIDLRKEKFQTEKTADEKKISEIGDRKIISLSGSLFMTLIGIVMFIGGRSLWRNGYGWGSIASLFLVPMGVILVGCSIILFLMGLFEDTKTPLQQAEHDKAEHEAIFNSDIAKNNAMISEYKKEINVAQSKIQNCQRYLDLGAETIACYWFAQECAAFGVHQSVDPKIIEYRNAVYAPVEEGTITVICPACGATITTEQGQALSDRQIVCAICGSPVDIESAACQTAPDSSVPESTVYWTCSACGWIHESAKHPDYCPICGADGDALISGVHTGGSITAEGRPDITSDTGLSDMWSCSVCGYIHEGATPPSLCPACHVPGGRFEKVGQ